MKLPRNFNLKFGLLAAILIIAALSALLFWNSHTPAVAQDAEKKTEGKAQPDAAKIPAGAERADGAGPVVKPTSPIQPAVAPGSAELKAPAAPETSSAPINQVATPTPRPEADKVVAGDEIQLGFQGANIDMVVQWLAKTTGKSVVKHPQVQCQLTIVSSKGLTARDAINLVYRALALEGFTAIESSKSILLVPEGKEPKMSPELIPSQPAVPEGRQRLIKIFPLKSISASDLKEKVRGVLSEKGTIDADDRASQVVVTDYNENIRLIGELIKELDVASPSDSVIELYSLKHSEADELANLLTLVLNTQAASSAAQARPAPSPGSPPPGSSPPPPGPSMPPPSSGSPAAPQQVRIWPDKTSNRLIVTAPKSRLPEVQKLIELLDTEKPRDVGLRVIPLKNVSAEDLVKEIGPLYQKMTGKSLKDMIEVTANNRSNSLIVLSSEANFKALEKLIASLDTEGAQEKVMQAFALKNADAEDVAKQLQDLSQDQQSFPRYFYYFSASEQRSKKMKVVADRRRNTVIVQAPPGQMESIGKMIQELDAPVTDNSLAPRIFKLKYISATDIEDVLNELFLKKTQQRPYWYYDDFPQETADRNVGRLYGKVRITSEPYSNSLIVTANSAEHLSAVEEVIKQLDAPAQGGESTLRVGLRFAKASTVANSINILFAKGGSPPLRPVAQPGQVNDPRTQQQQPATGAQSNFELEQDTKEEGYFPWLGGQPENSRTTDGRTIRPVSDLVGRVRVVPDHRSNSLLISANVHFFPQVLKLIQDLDVPTAQVLIEAKIVEVSTDFLDKLGVRWSPDGSQTFSGDDLDNSILLRSRGEYTKGFGGKTTVMSSATAATTAALVSSLRSGFVDSTISLDFLVQFLRKNTDATVLAEPQINIADNEMGRLFVGSQVPFIDKSQFTDVGGQNQSFSYKNVGVILEVTPHINNTGDVTLKIRAESSSIQPGQTLFGGAILDTRNFRTDLSAKNGETLVLGGIIQRQVSDTVRKVPVLGSIPGMGWAFKKKDKLSRQVELMVFLRPKVTRTPEQAKELLEEIERKAPKIKQSTEAAEEKK
ncbi:MAG: hypothetical protein L0Z50_11950 [Verrucomicrobiales bacterium]|nr:hypothetical protein [Verrucomicrobiales bacterium]